MRHKKLQSIHQGIIKNLKSTLPPMNFKRLLKLLTLTLHYRYTEKLLLHYGKTIVTLTNWTVEVSKLGVNDATSTRHFKKAQFSETN